MKVDIKALKAQANGDPINVEFEPLKIGEIRKGVEKTQEVENLARTGWIEILESKKKK
jgi:hypothetical protein